MKENKHMKTITKLTYSALSFVTLAIGALTANSRLTICLFPLMALATMVVVLFTNTLPNGVQSSLRPGFPSLAG